MTEAYQDYANFGNQERLTFLNDEGDNLEFVTRRNEGFGFLTGRVVGSGKDWEYGDFACNEYYELQNINVKLENDIRAKEKIIDFFVVHRIRDPEESNELIEILFSWINDRATSEALWGEVQATYNLTSGRVESIVSDEVSVNNHSTITIRNQEYTDVIEMITDDGITALYLQKERGPVAFVRNGVDYTKE